MVRLKSLTQWPIGGWQFVDAAISSDTLHDASWSYDRLCQEVQARRLNNPRFKLPTDMATVRREVADQNALRMVGLKGGEHYVVMDSNGVPDPNRAAPRQRSWLGVVGAARRVASGANVLADWLGDGGVPVASELSNQRAAICAGCPKNAPGNWTDWFTEAASEVIRAQFSVRNDMNLSTAHDDKLGVCDACGCPLKLKVHVPLAHIKDHLSDKVKKQLDPRCWILAES